MKFNYKLRIIILLAYFTNISVNAQAPAIQWVKSLGGSSVETAFDISQTSDGGYIVAGNTSSTDGDVIGNHGSTDYWIVKLSSLGIIEWQKCLGGSATDSGHSIEQTNDGGYIVAGFTTSNNGDVIGNHGSADCWIVKLTAIGNIEWQKSIGGSASDYGYRIQQTSDGGYIVAGYTLSNNGDVIGNHGSADYWIVKLTFNGTIEWQKCIGGSLNDYGHNIQQTNDGGFIMAGYSNSNNGDVSGNHGSADCWVVKLTAIGNIEWQKSYGGSGLERLYSIQQTNDQGYIFAGESTSTDGDVTGNNGLSLDYWIVKITSDGTMVWQKSIGGSNEEDSISDIRETSDGEYIICSGVTSSYDGDVIGNHGTNGNSDMYLLKLSASGVIVWSRCIGGSNTDKSYCGALTNDNGIITAGNSTSYDGDITVNNNGNVDLLVVKLGPDNLLNNTFTHETTITLFPNPAKEKITLKLDYFTPSQEISISDIQGKIIHTQKIESVSTTINTSSFEKGIYFLNVIDGNQKTTKKFIVE